MFSAGWALRVRGHASECTIRLPSCTFSDTLSTFAMRIPKKAHMGVPQTPRFAEPIRRSSQATRDLAARPAGGARALCGGATQRVRRRRTIRSQTRVEDCLDDAYRLRIAQLKASPSICERLVDWLRPLVSDGRRDEVPLPQRLAEKQGSGVVILTADRFAYSSAEWSRHVSSLPGVERVDRDLSDEIARSVSDGQMTDILKVAPSEGLFAAELPQGKYSCTQDVYFRVAGGSVRRAKDLDVDGVDVDDAEVDGDVCRKSRAFGTIDGAPAVMDDGSFPPSLKEEVSIRTIASGTWTPLCAVDIEFAPRLEAPETTGSSSTRACSPQVCSSLEAAAARLTKLAQHAPAAVEKAVLSTMSPAQKTAYAAMKRLAEVDTADLGCSARPDERLAPAVVDGEMYVARYGHLGMGCYGVASSDWSIEFSRIDAGAVRSVASFVVKVDRGPATGIRVYWPPTGKSG